MALKLTIDEGNTTAKYALWDGNTIVRQNVFHSADELPDAPTAIIASVRRGSDLIRRIASYHAISLSSNTPMPMEIGYSTPATLGADRIAACVGATAICRNLVPVLVVDIGTAVTYDVITPSHNPTSDCHKHVRYIFEGGNIAPGIYLRLKALNEFTSALPKVDVLGTTPLVACNTTDAMRSGATLGIAAEITYYRMTLLQTHHNLQTMITGGAAQLVTPHLDIPYNHVPDLVMIGLKRILDYNEAI